MKVKQFFDNEFINFSIYDCHRSIPSVIDGLKPSQRKCLYGMVKRGENAGEMKVAQAGSYIASVSDYHHGEISLCATIVSMARDFAGSNNINYLLPIGQFGSRLDKDSSAFRYIFTELSSDFRKVFNKGDDCILEYLTSDGENIEPKYYIPLLPNILINGATGIGTGFATSVLNHNPNDIIENILTILRGDTPGELVPWYKGFNGTITPDGDRYIIEGVYERVARNKIRITELPVGVFNDVYKKHLFKLQDAGFIKEFSNSSTEDSFDFLITTTKWIDEMSHADIIKKFKLESKESQNLTVWDEHSKIKVFDSTQAIINHFVEFRLMKYQERKEEQLRLLDAELSWSAEKHRFILFYIDNSKLFASKSKRDIDQLLIDNNFIDRSRLMDIRIYNLTQDDISKLETHIVKLEKEIKSLTNMTPKKMYIKELELLEF